MYELIDSILRAHKVHPEFHQEIMSLSLSDKDIRRQLDVQKKKEIDHTMNFIKAGLKEFDASIAIKDIEAASFVIHNTIEKTVHEIIYANTAIPEERIIGELVQMILKYLLCELPPQPSESPAEIKGWL